MANCANPVTQGKTQDRGTGVPLRLLKRPAQTAHGVSQAGRSPDRKPASQTLCSGHSLHTPEWPPALHTEVRPCSPLAGLLLRLCEASGGNRPSYSRPQVRVSAALLLRDLRVPTSVSPITEHRCYRTSQKPWLMAHRHDHVLRYGQ